MVNHKDDDDDDENCWTSMRELSSKFEMMHIDSDGGTKERPPTRAAARNITAAAATANRMERDDEDDATASILHLAFDCEEEEEGKYANDENVDECYSSDMDDTFAAAYDDDDEEAMLDLTAVKYASNLSAKDSHHGGSSWKASTNSSRSSSVVSSPFHDSFFRSGSLASHTSFPDPPRPAVLAKLSRPQKTTKDRESKNESSDDDDDATTPSNFGMEVTLIDETIPPCDDELVDTTFAKHRELQNRFSRIGGRIHQPTEVGDSSPAATSETTATATAKPCLKEPQPTTATDYYASAAAPEGHQNPEPTTATDHYASVAFRDGRGCPTPTTAADCFDASAVRDGHRCPEPTTVTNRASVTARGGHPRSHISNQRDDNSKSFPAMSLAPAGNHRDDKRDKKSSGLPCATSASIQRDKKSKAKSKSSGGLDDLTPFVAELMEKELNSKECLPKGKPKPQPYISWPRSLLPRPGRTKSPPTQVPPSHPPTSASCPPSPQSHPPTGELSPGTRPTSLPPSKTPTTSKPPKGGRAAKASVSPSQRRTKNKKRPAVPSQKKSLRKRTAAVDAPQVQSKKAVKQRSVAPPKERETNDVCIVLDTSNSMSKFLTPLRKNLETFWELVSSSDQKLRMSLLTPSRKLDFTSDKSEFLSFSAATQVEEIKPQDEGLSSVVGLKRALSHLGVMSWNRDSAQFIYIFTNLAYDTDNASLRGKIFRSLCDTTFYLPRSAEILVGCWMDDNKLLLDALEEKRFRFKGFGFLSFKAMASYVVDDKDLLTCLCDSMVVVKEKTDVKISEKWQYSPTPERLYVAGSQPVVCRARMFQIKPLQSVLEFRSEASFDSQACWMKREPNPSNVTNAMVFYPGKLGLEKDEWKENVVLKSYKLHAINKRPISQEHYRSRAFISAVAHFLAIQYNKEHRPKHCAKIRFLRGSVVEEDDRMQSGQQVFYAEELIGPYKGGQEFTEYCDAAGKWNEAAVDESLLRFAQTCFKLTGGDFMVAGLRGLNRYSNNTYILTTPSLLHRTFRDEHMNECNKEYMKVYRTETKRLLQEEGWNQQSKGTTNRWFEW